MVHVKVTRKRHFNGVAYFLFKRVNKRTRFGVFKSSKTAANYLVKA